MGPKLGHSPMVHSKAIQLPIVKLQAICVAEHIKVSAKSFIWMHKHYHI